MHTCSSYILRGLAGALLASGLSLSTASPVAAACSVSPDVASSRIQSADLDNRFGPVAAPGKPLKFAYVTQLMEDPFWTEVLQGLKSETSRLGIELSATAPKDRQSLTEQMAVAKAALATKPDVLLLTPINATNLRPVIDEANALGIPTISINLKTEGVRTHIGTENTSLGIQAAEFLHENFPAGAAVAQLEGEKTSPYRIERVKGFKEGLSIYPTLSLAASQSADWDKDKAYKATLAMMAEQPEIKGIYANSDLMAVGAVQALEEIGRKDVVVIGTDGVRPAKESIAAGKLKATTAQFPAKEGRLAVQIGIRLLTCQPIPGWVVSPNSVMTAKSLGDYAVLN